MTNSGKIITWVVVAVVAGLIIWAVFILSGGASSSESYDTAQDQSYATDTGTQTSQDTSSGAQINVGVTASTSAY